MTSNVLAFSYERIKMNSDHTMMRGAFVCYNGLLGDCARPHSLHWPSSSAPGYEMPMSSINAAICSGKRSGRLVSSHPKKSGRTLHVPVASS
jgi:hypothetical protein